MEAAIMNDIGKRIKELRKKHHLSQTTFANRIGVSSGNVGDWESDKKKSTPSAKAILAISREFQVSTDWIISGKESTVRNNEKKKSFFSLEKCELNSQIKHLAEEDRELLEEIIELFIHKKVKRTEKENASKNKHH